MAYLPPGGGRMNVTLGGNTAGAMATVSTGTLGLHGGNNITLSQNGNNITVSGGAAGITNVNLSAGTTSNNLSNMVFSNSNGLSFGLNGSTVTASHNAITNLNLSAGTTSNNLSKVTFADSNGVSFGLNGSVVTGTVATNYAASNHSHGNPTLNLTNLSGTTASASNGLTLSLSAAAPGGGAAFSAGTQSVNTGTVKFADSNGISFGMSGSSQITASYTVPTQSVQTLGWYASGANTIGQSSSTTLDARSVNVSGQGAISAGFSGSTMQISAPATSGLSATGAVSISSNGATISIGAPVQTNQTMGIYLTGTNTTGQSSSNTMDARSFVVSGQGMYAGMSGSTLQLSAATTYAASNHSHGNPTLNLTNLSGTTASASNGFTLSLSAANPGAGGGVALSAGTQSVSTGTVKFADSNGISFGMSGSSQITASYTVPTQSAQTLGLYASGANTIGQSSSTTLDARSFNFSGQGGISAGYSGSTMQISAPATSSLSATGAVSISVNANTISIGAPTQTNQSLGVYATGNTTQSSSGTIDARSLTFQGTGNVSVGVTNGSVVISGSGGGGGGTISNFEPLLLQHGSISNSQLGNGSVYFFKLQVPANVSASQLMQLASISVSTTNNSSHAGVISLGAGIFTATGSTLSLITQSSGTTAVQWTNTANNSLASISGLRGLSLPMNFVASPGNYYLGMWSRTSTTQNNWFTASNMVFTQGTNSTANTTFQGFVGQAANNTQGIQEAVGMFSATSAGLPTNVPMSQITQNNFRSIAMPYVAFKNVTY